MSFEVRTTADLLALRERTDLDDVVVDTTRLRYRGLLPLAARYALWAVRPGGRLTFVDHGPRDASSHPYSLPFNALQFVTSRFLGRDAQLLESGHGELSMERTAPVPEAGWGAGVVFSGLDAELPTLATCLRGLLTQQALRSDRGGRIVVCGPSRSLGFLDDFPGVDYLDYPNSPDGRVYTSAKKNALMRHVDMPRMLILHSRVVMDDDCLSRAPREFDIAAPNVRSRAADGSEQPYLSLVQTDAMWPGRTPRRTSRSTRVLRRDHLELHERGPVYVDGGAFMVMRDVVKACPMADDVAWGEYEDMEWSARAFTSGFLSDLIPSVGAVSQTSKLRDLPRLGAATVPAVRLRYRAQELLARSRHHVEALVGRR